MKTISKVILKILLIALIILTLVPLKTNFLMYNLIKDNYFFTLVAIALTIFIVDMIRIYIDYRNTVNTFKRKMRENRWAYQKSTLQGK